MLPTITIESTRLFSSSEMGLLLGCVVVVAAIAWMAMTHARHDR